MVCGLMISSFWATDLSRFPRKRVTAINVLSHLRDCDGADLTFGVVYDELSTGQQRSQMEKPTDAVKDARSNAVFVSVNPTQQVFVGWEHAPLHQADKGKAPIMRLRAMFAVQTIV